MFDHLGRRAVSNSAGGIAGSDYSADDVGSDVCKIKNW